MTLDLLYSIRFRKFNNGYQGSVRASGFSGMEWWTGTVEWNGGLNGGKNPLCLSVKTKVLILTYKHVAHVPKLIYTPWHNFNWRPKLIS